MNKALTSLLALVAIAVAFIAINILSMHTMRGVRMDLTSDKLYTLSPGTHRIAKSLDEPVTLKLYFSEKQVDELPSFKTYGQRVKELLREYAAMSGGKIRLEMIDPEPFTQAEDDATAAGLVGAATGRGQDRLYFGIVGTGATDQQQVLPFLDPKNEQFLEYDLSRMIYLLSNPKKKSIGVMSWLPLDGGQPNPMMRQMPQPWQILVQLREYFNVRMVEPDAADIPSDIAVLMVVHPKQMSEQTQYAIDQFVLRGGRVLLFVDPLCDMDVPPGVNPMQAMGMPKNSDLPKLLSAWGVELIPEMVAGDRRTAVRVNVGSQNAPRAADYLIWMNVGAQTGNLSKTDQVTGNLQSMLLASAGVLRKKEGATTSIEPLIETTTESMLIPVANVSFMPDPDKLIRDFISTDAKQLLAARITGKVRTAFPGGRPPIAPPPVAPEGGEAPGGALLKQDSAPPAADGPTLDPAQLTESKDDVNIIVVTDCDMLADRFWITEDRFLGQIPMGYRKMSDNGDFVIGAVDQLSGSSDLLSLRARGLAARPFELVEKIRREANQRYQQSAQKLQDSLQQTETQIAELQRQRGEGASSDFILSPEQQAALEEFNKKRLDIRRELRDVQHQLSSDIEGLGTRIKFLNIAMMPAVVALVAVGLGVYRGRQRTIDRARSARG